MNRVVLVTVLVLVGVALGAATATAQVESHAVGSTPAADPGNASETNNSSVSLGASISAFMQSNSERATQAVDQGMWSAEFERSDRARKQALAESHAGTLGDRLDALAEERQALIAAYRNNSISKVAFQARMSALGERYRALNQSVDDTKRAVGRESVDAPGLADLDRSLQRGASTATVGGDDSLPANVTIPEFDRGPNAHAADNRSTGPSEDAPGNADRGPPDDANGGPPANASDGPSANASDGPSANATDGAGGPNPAAPNGTTTTTVDTTLDADEPVESTVNVTVTDRIAAPNAEQTPF